MGAKTGGGVDCPALQAVREDPGLSARVLLGACHPAARTMAAPPQLQTLLLAVNALLRKRRYHAVLAMLKGFRNGAVYGAKIRAPHALVMTFLFRSGRVVKEDLLEKVAWNQGLNQPPGEAARHPTGHVHPLPEPGQLCVHLQGTLRPAVPPAGGDLPGALIPGCLHWGLAGIWKQQYHQQPVYLGDLSCHPSSFITSAEVCADRMGQP
ncbi:peroxisomal membrane protein 4 isoform X4 [Camelus ferus]|uniref:Peroxisomal membrane protein 4 isoform X4 n=1 Tax=Camelus ferus TaxID=419612 RepID=A0A8B8RJA2_CAMFR|nr:peroxisomal membrane protein 4 isoform X4 [Camelus ferus]